MNIVIHRTSQALIPLVLIFHSMCYPHQYQDVNRPDVLPGSGYSENEKSLSTSFWTLDSAIQKPVAANLNPTLDSILHISVSATVPEHPRVLPDSASSQTYSFQEIVVTSARIPQTTSYTPSSVTVLSRREVESMNGISLAEVISPANGIFMKDYGAGSGLKTISQRGLGAEHTLILVNGLRVSSLQNGQMNLGSMSVDEIESVEIVRGGQSAVYGADAVAGLVNIVTRPAAGHNSFRALGSFGSFGYRRYHVSGNLSSGSDGVRLNYGEERSNEDYPFLFRNGPQVSKVNRQNSDIFTRYADASAGLGVWDGTRLTVFGSTYLSERGVGGKVVSPFSSIVARQTDKDYLLQATLSSLVTENISFGFTVQSHVAYERYRDPDLNIGGAGLDSYFKNNDVRMEPHVDITVNEMMKVGIGSELVRTSAEGNSLVKDVIRTQMGTFLAGEVILEKGHGVVPGVSIFPSARFDAISSMAPTWSPQLGALAEFWEFDAGFVGGIKTAVRSSVSRNFRMPTFNELYFNGGGGIGNPALLPERSTSADAGASVRFLLDGEHVAQATYFVNDMRDRIVWVAAGSGSVSPKNLRRVRSEGVELSYRWDLPDKTLSLQTNYTTSSSRKISLDYPGDPTVNTQLIYIPQEMFTLSANSTINIGGSVMKEMGLQMSYSFTGFRYYTEDNTAYLPAHKLVNVGIRGKITIDRLIVLAKLEINNLLNQEYEVMLGYPMPMRSYRVTFGTEY